MLIGSAIIEYGSPDARRSINMRSFVENVSERRRVSSRRWMFSEESVMDRFFGSVATARRHDENTAKIIGRKNTFSGKC